MSKIMRVSLAALAIVATAFLMFVSLYEDLRAQFRTLTSEQVGSSPQAGYVLQTDGSVSTWVAASALGSPFPFTPTTYAGVGVNATSTGLWLKATSPFSLIASSTLSDNASTTRLSTTNLFFSGVASPAYSQGMLVYDTDNESLTFFNGESDIGLQIGQENYMRVRNETGSTITNGQVVYVNGNHAGTGLPTVALADADAETTAIAAGVATHDIENNTTGYITTEGTVRGLNTAAFSNGDRLYVSSTAGALTATIPNAPAFRNRVAIVTKAAGGTAGSLYVSLTAVRLGNGTANQVFGMNSAATGGEYKTISGTASEIDVTHGANSITIGLVDPLAVSKGGTGLASCGNNQIVTGGATLTCETTFTYDGSQIAMTYAATGLTSSLLINNTDADATSGNRIVLRGNGSGDELINYLVDSDGIAAQSATGVDGLTGSYGINVGGSSVGAVGDEFTINLSGLVGIGTTTPIEQVDIYTANATSSISLTRQDNGIVANDGIGVLLFKGSDLQQTSSFTYASIGVKSQQAVTTDAAAGNLVLSTTDTTVGGIPQPRMTIGYNGDSGVGTTSPGYTWGVAGDASFGGTVSNRRRLDIDTNGLATFYASNNANVAFFTVLNGGITAAGQGANITFGMSTSTGAIAGYYPNVARVSALAEGDFSTAATAIGGLGFDVSPTVNTLTRAMTITSAGNVGIGTSTPQRRLWLTNTGANPQLGLEDSAAAANQHYWGFGTSRGSFFINSMTDALATTTRLNIDTSGQVGIGMGTNAISAALEVRGSNAFLYQTSSTTATYAGDNGGLTNLRLQNDDTTTSSFASLLLVAGNATSGRVGLNAVRTGSNTADFTITTRTGSSAYSERLRITSGGNVGIGTSTPGSQLTIDSPGGANSNDGITLSNSSSGQAYSLIPGIASLTNTTFQIRDRTAGATRFAITNTGLTGIATTTPWRTLSVDGTVALNGLSAASASTIIVCIESGTTKEVKLGNSATTCNPSTIKAKQNVLTLGDSLEDFMKLRPVSFNYKPEYGDPSIPHLGFIAEEVHAIHPELAHVNAKGEPDGLNLDAILSLTVKAVQEQNERIRTLESAGTDGYDDSAVWLAIWILSALIIALQLQILYLYRRRV